MSSWTRGIGRILIAILLAVPLGVVAGSRAPAAASDQVGIPVLAYYYIWYTPSSWHHAKSDLPLLGPYSSDESAVMEAHAKEAKAAGLDGFLVSWKQTSQLDYRLAMLVRVASEYGLKLGIVYEGLNVLRRPLPPERVASDLRWFTQHYGHNPVFSIQGRPLVIWSGTWEFTPQQIEGVTRQVRGPIRVLASQRDAEEYRSIAGSVDGNAYYWSSLDPQVDTRAQERLNGLSDAVHATGGMWVPSVAPGFDARLNGGHRVVPRNDGDTLRAEWRLAMRSSPDMVGIVSWNEFTENSDIEPSRNNGNESLRALASILSATVPPAITADSSEPGGTTGFPIRAVALLVVAFGIVAGSLAVLGKHRRDRRGGAGRDDAGSGGPDDPDGDPDASQESGQRSR